MVTNIWVVITGVGFVMTAINSYRAKKAVSAVKRDTTLDLDRKWVLLGLAYAGMLRQLGMMLAVGFNFAAGLLVLLVDPSPERSSIAVTMLIASAATLTVLSTIEAIRDE